MTTGTPLPVPYSIKRHGISLSSCDDEPVQTPGCIQAHGMLLALRCGDLVVTQVSENCEHWSGLSVDQALGAPLSQIVGATAADRIQALTRTEALDHNPCYALTAKLPGSPADAPPMDMTIHTADGVLLLEMEPSGRGPPVVGQDGDYFSMVRKTIGRLKSTRSLADFCEVVAREARSITGLDRAMVYRFHADDSGEVMADARRDDLPSWLGLRYPASDIPKPAREIFKRIGVRPLPDAQGALCEMVPLLNPDTQRPLEMTHCALRGASVMYTEYLQNMGVAATLTMPILRDGALWGLIACHHYTARPLPYPLRSAAEFLAQIASLEIAQAELREHLQYRVHLDAVHLAVLARAASDGQLSVAGLSSPSLLDGIHADGVAVFQRGRWMRAGLTPDEPQLELLAPWLRERVDEAPDGLQAWATDALGAAYPAAAGFAELASGVLATAVSRHVDSPLILWFRGEQVQTFNWAGNPHEKPTAVGPLGPRLTPRRSFDLWQEQVRGRSRPWRKVEVEAAQQMRLMVMDLVVVRAEQLAEANAELARSNAELDAFAYVAGHDLKEPLRGINKYANSLLEDAQAGRVHDPARVEWLLRLTVRMDTLLNALLHFSRVGRMSLELNDTDLGPVLVESIEMLGARLAESQIEVRVPRPLPHARCDRVRVREVFSNLISNAAKYNDKAQRWVEIGHIGPNDAAPVSAPPETGGHTLFYVRDNGIGIDMRQTDRVFAIFKRLHPQDAFGGGSGAGLTIARKMVEQHGGRIWFDSQPGAGSTFYFTLPGIESAPGYSRAA
ncbi:MAG: ATP-binding protein [Burkholderiales bacterium]|nr:ATP-binding protein [Burkholderiales bacterium]